MTGAPQSDQQQDDAATVDALVIGGGPAGLMAADRLAAAGRRVVLAEARPTVGRKLLMAGKSGLNLTRVEPRDSFLARYGDSAPRLGAMLGVFGSDQVQDWARDLGQPLFTGSTGRVFPTCMKASPLLRAWLARLAQAGVSLRTGWRWQGWDGDALAFDTRDGARMLRPRVCVLALGGASWPRLGSDAAWVPWLAGQGVEITPFAPANAGVSVPWSAHMKPHFGSPIKGIALHAGNLSSRGEIVLSHRGIEGGGIYALTPAIRAGAPLTLDLLPDLPAETVIRRLSAPRRKATLTNHLRKTLGLSPAKIALVHEFARPLPVGAALGAALKSLAVVHDGPRPLAEAISSAGGVAWSAVDDHLMLRARSGIFVAGEMLDWEAPTGGYLLTACLSTGRWAGDHAAGFADPGRR